MKGKKSGPIHIVSDRLDAYNEQKLAVFTGNVVATEGDKVIKSDHLLLYNKKDEDKAKQKPKGDEESGDIDRIEARGNVRITQGTKIVTGENAVYLNDDQKIIVTGNPVMKDGDNVIKGDKIIVLLDEDRGVVESSGPQRVSATFYPDDKNKKTDPKQDPAQRTRPSAPVLDPGQIEKSTGMGNLEAKGLVKIYGHRRVVNEIDINVKPGEVVGLLGPNGAGKTTTFYMIVGLIRPDGGSIFLNDNGYQQCPDVSEGQARASIISRRSLRFSGSCRLRTTSWRSWRFWT